MSAQPSSNGHPLGPRPVDDEGRLTLTLRVNGQEHRVRTRSHHTLLEVLRDELKLVGTREGCGIGMCGACTVHVDGNAVSSCLLLAALCEGKMTLTLRVNGRDHVVRARAHHTLLEVLRNEVGLTGPREGCGVGMCGACTVLLDGRPVSGCLVLAPMAEGRDILTIEGMEAPDGTLHRSSRRTSTTPRSSARTARRASSSPPRRSSTRSPTRAASGRPSTSPATSAAAAATSRSSTP